MTMKTSQAGIDAIKGEEQLRLKAYADSKGIMTIGYGHVILPNETFTVITEQEAEGLLRQDLATAENCINANVNVAISQNQFDALVSFVFNAGCNAFKKSTLLAEVNNAANYV